MEITLLIGKFLIFAYYLIIDIFLYILHLRRLQSGYWLVSMPEIFMSRGSLSSSLTGLLVAFYSTQHIIQRVFKVPWYVSLKEQCTTWKLIY